jgi:hypothetical protein
MNVQNMWEVSLVGTFNLVKYLHVTLGFNSRAVFTLAKFFGALGNPMTGTVAKLTLQLNHKFSMPVL